MSSFHIKAIMEKRHSDDDSQATVRRISHKKTSSDVIKHIVTDKEFQRGVSSYCYEPTLDEKLQLVGDRLRQSSIDYELKKGDQTTIPQSTRTKEILDQIEPKYKEKYRILVERVDAWKMHREMLIVKLSNYISRLDNTSKMSTAVRFLSSTIDVSGSVGGLLLAESEWANHALKAASFFGLCGLFCTVAEVDTSKRILDDVSESIEEDLKLLTPIVSWFEMETSDLDLAVQELFPHGIDREIVQQIQEQSEEQDNYLKVFRAALVSNVRRDTNLFENRDFLHSLQLFARSEVSYYWWNKILYRKHPIELDLSRMALQMEFGQLQSIVFQCIPALPLEQQRLGSLPVAGRIMLNLLTMYDSLTDLRKGATSMYSDKLRKHLGKMTTELKAVEKIVKRMEPQEINDLDL